MKLSLKLLKNIVTGAKEPMTYDQIVERLDKDQVAYNEPMLQGVILQSLDKGNFIVKDGDPAANIVKCTFGPKPRQSTGGGTPTTMYKLKNGLKPDAEKASFQEKPYEKAVVEEDPLWASTRLAAVKAAKSHFYNTIYWPALEQFRQMEEALTPTKTGDEEDPAGEEEEDAAA